MIHFESVEARRLMATQVVADLSGDGVRPRNFMAYDGGVAFTGQSGYSRSELWVSDGTVDNTRRVVSESNYSGLSKITPVMAINGVILFTAYDVSGTLTLYSANDGGLVQPLFRLGSTFTKVSFTRWGKFAWFSSNSGYLGRTDGTPVGTVGLSGGFGSINALSGAGRYVFFTFDASAYATTMLARTDGSSRPVIVNENFDVDGPGEAAGSTYVVPSQTDGSLGLYGVSGTGRPRLIGKMTKLNVIRNEAASSYVYVIGQTSETAIPQLYRTDGTTLTSVTRLQSHVLNASSVIRTTANGLYFTDGAANLYFVGHRDASARLIAAVPADAKGRAGVIAEFAVARDGTVFLRRTTKAGSSLLRLGGGGLRELGPMSSTPASLGAIGTTAFFARDDGAGYDELWTAGRADRRASQKTAISGSPTDLGVQSFAPLKDGILAVTVAPADGERVTYEPQVMNTTAYFLKEGQPPQFLGMFRGNTYAGSRDKLSNTYAAGSTAFFTVLNHNDTTGQEVASLYRTDGTADGTRLMTVGLPSDPFYLGRGGSFAFFSVPKSKTVLAVPLRGRGKVRAITLNALPSGEVVFAANNLYVQCGTNQVIELNGATGEARDLNVAARLPRNSMQNYLQVWNDQLVLLVQRRKVTEAYLLINDLPTLAASYTATRDRFVQPPAMSRDGQTMWVISTDIDGSSFLIRMNLGAHTADQSAVLAAKKPMTFFDSGKPISTSPWARGQIGDKLIYTRGSRQSENYVTDGTTAGTPAFTDAIARNAAIDHSKGLIFSQVNNAYSQLGLFQSDELKHDVVSLQENKPSDVAVISDKVYFIGDSIAGREVMSYTYQPSRISGVIFNDTDRDGVRDSNETPVVGARVFIDSAYDNYLSWDENSVLTDSAGRYTFANIDNGTHRVAVILQVGSKAVAADAVTLTGNAKIVKNFGLKN